MLILIALLVVVLALWLVALMIKTLIEVVVLMAKCVFEMGKLVWLITVKWPADVGLRLARGKAAQDFVKGIKVD